jgi:hypothetical protein
MSEPVLTRARHSISRLRQMPGEIGRTRVSTQQTQRDLAQMHATLAGAQAQIASLEQATARIEAAVSAGRAEQEQLKLALDATHRDLQRSTRVLELIYEQESENLPRLIELRRSDAYELAYTDPEPLVSVIIPTYLQHELLVSRAIPSALSQTHRWIEVVVVGDAAPTETERAIRELKDPRVRYENLTVRGPYPDDPRERWSVAGSTPFNTAWQMARGRWIAPLNDDDAFRPDHVEKLLAAARSQHLEVVYGRVQQHDPSGGTQVLGSWPPESHGFAWQSALAHAGLGFMPLLLGAGALGAPGDWSLCRRMCRAGARFAMIEDVVVDYYPSLLWRQDSELLG